MSSTDEASHAAEAYSRVERTGEVYAALFTCLVHSLRLRRKKPSVFDAFAVVASIWVCHDMSLLIFTPRYFPLSTTSSVCPCSL